MIKLKDLKDKKNKLLETTNPKNGILVYFVEFVEDRYFMLNNKDAASIRLVSASSFMHTVKGRKYIEGILIEGSWIRELYKNIKVAEYLK